MAMERTTKDMTLQESFERFHAENPHVYDLVLRYARQAKSAGRQRFSMDMIFHRMRWYTQVETNDPDFKLNDHYTAFYARMIMRDHPDEFAEFFETRTQRGLRVDVVSLPDTDPERAAAAQLTLI